MALTGEILGGLAPGLLTGGAGFLAGGRTALRQGGKMGLGRLLGTEAAVGAGTGAVAGAGTADPGERGAGAGLGAGLGATLGVALPAIGAGVKGAVGGARRGLGMMTRNEAEEAAKRKLSGALARDQVTPQEIIEQIPEGPGFGPIDESVADLAGEMFWEWQEPPRRFPEDPRTWAERPWLKEQRVNMIEVQTTFSRPQEGPRRMFSRLWMR